MVPDNKSQWPTVIFFSAKIETFTSSSTYMSNFIMRSLLFRYYNFPYAYYYSFFVSSVFDYSPWVVINLGMELLIEEISLTQLNSSAHSGRSQEES